MSMQQALIAGYGASVTPPVGPPVTSGLLLWMDATTLAYGNGVRVDAWPDSSVSATPTSVGSGNPTMASTGLNGHPGVDFYTTGASWYVAATATTGLTEGTLIAVSKNILSGLSGHPFGFGSVQDGWYPYSDNNIYDSNFSVNRSNASMGSVGSVLTSPNVYVSAVSATQQKVSVNRVTMFDVANTYRAPAQDGTAGHCLIGNGGEISSAIIGEVLYYGRKLTDAEILSMQNYLSTKWGTP